LASGTAEELYNNPLVRQYYLGDKFQFWCILISQNSDQVFRYVNY
jgi:hypothetical protein